MLTAISNIRKASHFKHKVGKFANIVNPNHRHDEEHEKKCDDKRTRIAESHRFDSFFPERVSLTSMPPKRSPYLFDSIRDMWQHVRKIQELLLTLLLQLRTVIWLSGMSTEEITSGLSPLRWNEPRKLFTLQIGG